MTAVSAEIRVRNREVTHDQSRAASVAGDYYVAVLLDPVTSDPKGRVMKIRLRVAVEGEPQGQPVYANTAPSPSVSDGGPQASTTESPASGDAGSTSPGGSVTLPLMLLAVVAALGVGTGLFIGFRRGKPSV